MWRYHHIEGVGDNIDFGFTDTLMNGEYRLTLSLLANDAGIPAGLVRHIAGSNSSALAGQSPERIRVGAKLQEQNLITKVDPIYPPLAMQARIQGVVRFTVVIGKDGRVSDIQLVNDHPLFVATATDALRQWVYKPTLLNGDPVEVVTQVDVNFTLGGNER
jgi:TonB family protein